MTTTVYHPESPGIKMEIERSEWMQSLLIFFGCEEFATLSEVLKRRKTNG